MVGKADMAISLNVCGAKSKHFPTVCVLIKGANFWTVAGVPTFKKMAESGSGGQPIHC